jgi:hypothetical protein
MTISGAGYAVQTYAPPASEICSRTTDENRMKAMKHSPSPDLVAVLRGAPAEGLSVLLAFLFR